MSSKFKRKNRKIVGNLVDQLINHITEMDNSDENFGIAQKFIINKLDNNPFPDTNEFHVKREWADIVLKLRLHSQEDRAGRLKYLYEEFMKRKTFE